MADAPPAFSATPAQAPRYSRTSEAYDSAPIYQEERYRDVWEHWEIVDRASQRITEGQATLAELEPELKAKVKEGERLKEKSSKLFASLHDKPRLGLSKHFRSGSTAKATENKDLLRQEFEAAHREETAFMPGVEEMQARVDTIKAQIKKDVELGSTVDQVFELLGASVAGSGLSSASAIYAEEQLASLSDSYELAQKVVTDLTRARVTVQHAHHYYTIVLKTLDAVRGTAWGRAVIGGMGEQSKNKDYQVAADTASKAQICFNETIRVLTPHVDTLPSDILADFDGLKELGLLQASKIYGLMYGWQTKTSTIGKGIKLMLEKQENAYAKLTRLAVWVQDRVPICEAHLRVSRDSRDQARRELAKTWKTLADQGD